MEVIERIRIKPWWEQLMDMSKGEIKTFSWNNEKSIRNAISNKILNEFPDAKFKTRKVEIARKGSSIKYLEVERNA